MSKERGQAGQWIKINTHLLYGLYIVAILPTGCMESLSEPCFIIFNIWRCQAVQSHLVVIVVTSLTALDQIDAKNMGMSPDKHNYSFLKINLQQSLQKWWTEINLVFVITSNTLQCLWTVKKSGAPASQHRMEVSNMFTKINRVYLHWRRNSERDELFYLLLFFMLCRFRCADGTLTLQ